MYNNIDLNIHKKRRYEMDIIKQGKNDTEKEKPEVTEQINVNQLISLVPEEEPAPVIKLEITEEDQKTIENFHFPAYNEIPDVGLFLEQTGKYINEFLRPLLKTELTGSMISNYVKKKIILYEKKNPSYNKKERKEENESKSKSRSLHWMWRLFLYCRRPI